MNTHRKYKNLIVNKRLQLGLVLKLFIVFTLFGGILSLIFYYSFWPTIMDYVPFALLQELNRQIIYRIVWGFLPFTLIMLGGAVLLTHKIAGPAYNMEKTLDQLLEEGDYDCIHLRKGDEFQELAEKINQLIEREK